MRYAAEPILHTSLSKVYSMQGDYDSALKAISAAISLAQKNPTQNEYAYMELANLYGQMGLISQQNHILNELKKDKS